MNQSGPESFVNVLGVVYFHSKTSDGGDIYLTQFGHPLADFLQTENWYEKDWFEQRREKLLGTGSVFKVPTKPIDGRSITLVVKNCRMGENVPLDTHTLYQFINAEFNSPWEEFSLVMEMRENAFGPGGAAFSTQAPLAIYVPPEKLQFWQTGRSRAKMNKIAARHPGVDLDILKQYKLIYQWIEGQNVVEALEGFGLPEGELEGLLPPITKKAIADLDKKGYAIADMKPVHIIVGQGPLSAISAGAGGNGGASHCAAKVRELVEGGEYSVVDYELLLRTAGHEQQVMHLRRHSYLDHQTNRFRPTPLPTYLKATELLGVPYIYGHVESTGGRLWVVGKDPNLFDYFLPERWRKTPARKLSAENEVYYTLTKDNVHVVWRTSKIGELPEANTPLGLAMEAEEPDKKNAKGPYCQHCYNSPFEEFAAAQFLNEQGIATVYVRAIYETGSAKLEQSADADCFRRHRELSAPDGTPVLRDDRNYITIQGYYNGPDRWVAENDSQLYRPLDLLEALATGRISRSEYSQLYRSLLERLSRAGFDGSLLSGNDALISLDAQGSIVRDSEGVPEARICNFELIRKK